jgi:hypothetical protein
MKNEENILTKIDLEEKSIILDMYENSLKFKENLVGNFNELNSCLISSKILFKSNSLEHNGSPNEIVSSNSKIIKIFSLLNFFKFKYFHTSESEINFNTDVNLIIYKIYKILFQSGNKKIINDLNILIKIIFYKFFGENILIFDNFKDYIDVKSSNNNLNYENFQKYFKIIVKFFIFKDNFENIFQILEKNEKILTAELIICLNKINRGLNENNLFYIISKKFNELIDVDKINLNKKEFFQICLKSLII